MVFRVFKFTLLFALVLLTPLAVAGARVEVAPYKNNPMDFVIWKPSIPEQPGWESPWGRGRPGWHIECSAMAQALLGDVFDIHGGGIDLAFPHHENEVAQSCCANHTEVMANVWMHNGFLQIEGEKMAKSLGNFFTVKDLRGNISGMVIRHVLMSAHYRSPLDWSEAKVTEAKSILNRWILLEARWRRAPNSVRESSAASAVVDAQVVSALSDELNMSLALQRLHQMATSVSVELDFAELAAFTKTLEFLGFCLGTTTGRDVSDTVEDVIDRLCTAIDDARVSKDYALADRLRAGLKDAGVSVSTSRDGTVGERTIDFDLSKLEALK